MVTQKGTTMQDDICIVADHSISWAARLLVDQHGDQAPLMAAKCARDMVDAGRMDLACAWEVVYQAVLGIVGDGIGPVSATLH